MTFLASSTVFALVVFAAMIAVALAAVTLVVLIVRDWRRGKLW